MGDIITVTPSQRKESSKLDSAQMVAGNNGKRSREQETKGEHCKKSKEAGLATEVKTNKRDASSVEMVPNLPPKKKRSECLVDEAVNSDADTQAMLPAARPQKEKIHPTTYRESPQTSITGQQKTREEILAARKERGNRPGKAERKKRRKQQQRQPVCEAADTPAKPTMSALTQRPCAMSHAIVKAVIPRPVQVAQLQPYAPLYAVAAPHIVMDGQQWYPQQMHGHHEYAPRRYTLQGYSSCGYYH